MRKLCFAPLVVCGMLLSLLTVTSADETQNVQDGGWRELAAKKLSIPLKQPSTDDYLIEMARAANVNILADAGNFPETAPPLAGEWEKTNWSTAKAGQWSGGLLSLFLELANERKLVWQRHRAGTYLFWSEPDMAELGRALVTAAPLPTPLAAVAPRRIADRAIDDALRDYFAQAYNWKLDGKGGSTAQAAYKDPGIPRLRISDLPAPLRDQLLDYCRAPMLRELTQGQNRFWFSDAFWQGARLQAFKLPADGKLRIRIIGLADRDDKNTLHISNGLPLLDNAN